MIETVKLYLIFTVTNLRERGSIFTIAVLMLSSYQVQPAIAQVISDRSTNTLVISNENAYIITGGTAIGGRNLFHSFERFDIPSQGIARFVNAPGIVNIFSRVTGEKASEIDGIIRSTGTANLFLINPNGIAFGQNAALEIGGSFTATTLSGVRFGDRGEFSAIDQQKPSDLLTVDPSAFIANRTPGKITANQSVLRVPAGETLRLLGGDIAIRGAELNAPLRSQIRIGERINIEGVDLIVISSNILQEQLDALFDAPFGSSTEIVAASGTVLIDAEGRLNLSKYP